MTKNAKISVCNSQGWNSLMLGLQTNNLKILKTMVEGGTGEETRWKYGIKSWVEDCWKAMEAVTKEGWNILHVCSLYSDKEVIEYVLEVLKHREDIVLQPDCPKIFSKQLITPLSKLIESACRKKNTPFLLAVKHNKLDAVELLVQNDCNIYARNGKLQNALHIASSSGYIKIIEYLITLDADKNLLRSQLDIQQRRPKDLDVSNKLEKYFYHVWDYAKLGDLIRLERVLASNKFSVDQATRLKQATPLHVAVENKQLHIIRALIALGANPELKNSIDKTPLDLAVEMNNPEYQAQVARLLSGDQNLIETQFSFRKLNDFYYKLMKRYPKKPVYLSKKRLKQDLNASDIVPDNFDLESEDYWEKIRKLLIEKGTTMGDMYEKISVNKNTPALTFNEFQSLLSALGLVLDPQTAKKIFLNADENKNNLLEYSEALKKIHIVGIKNQKNRENVPKLKLNKSFN